MHWKQLMNTNQRLKIEGCKDSRSEWSRPRDYYRPGAIGDFILALAEIPAALETLVAGEARD